MAKVLFYRCLGSQYDALASVHPDALYFLEDRGKLFLGEREITECLMFVESWDLPNLPILGKFYLNTVTGEFKCCDAHGLRTIVPPIGKTIDSFDDPQQRDYLASIGAIKDYVLREIQHSTAGVTDVTFDPVEGNIDIVKNGEPVSVPITGVAHSPTYENLVITIPVYGSEDLVINIPKDTFIRSGRYEPDYPLPDPPGGHGPAIVLVVGDGEQSQEIVIPAASLVQIYTGGTTDTLTVRVNQDTGVITGTVNIADAVNNLITSSENGLMVDGSGLARKNMSLQQGEVVLSDGQGNFLRSEVFISNQELKAGYLATGDVIAQAIATAIGGAINPVEERVAALEERLPSINDDEIIIGQDNKYVSSGKTIGGAVLQYPALDTVVATEMAVKSAIRDAMMQWDEIDPYPGYKKVAFTYAVQSAGGDPTVAATYPPENAIDGDASTVWYPAVLHNFTRLTCGYCTGPQYIPIILAITFVVGPSGAGAIDMDHDIFMSITKTGHTQQLGTINQGDIYANCVANGGSWTYVINNTLSCNNGSLNIPLMNADGRWGGLGISEVEYYIKEV